MTTALLKPASRYLPINLALAIDMRSRFHPLELAMANKKSDILSAKEIAAAEELVDRIVAEQLGKNVAAFFDPSEYSDVPPSKDQLMPNGKKLGDCNKRDLLILSHAYNQAAERMDSNILPKVSVARKF